MARQCIVCQNAALLLLLVACVGLLHCDHGITGASEESSKELKASTDKQNYTVNEVVFFTIQNNTGSTRYFSRCGARFVYLIHRHEGGNWIHTGGWGWICKAIYLMGERPLFADSSYTDFTRIPEAGKYRILFRFKEQKNEAGLDSLWTNEFTVQ